MTLPKIDNNGLTNALWRSRIDGGIDQINTNTTAIATNASNIASNDTDIATNASNISTNASNIASNLTKINDDLLQANTTIAVHAVNDVRVTGHHSINYTSSTALQDAISALPKNMSGHDITIHFQNGSYTFDYRINIYDFTGGSISVVGLDSEKTTKAVSKSVDITFTGTTDSTGGFQVSQCSYVGFYALHIKYSDSDINAIWFVGGSVGTVRGCFIENTDNSSQLGEGVLLWSQSSVDVLETIFDNNQKGIGVYGNSHLRQHNCQDRPTFDSGNGHKPTYGIVAGEASVVGAETKADYGTIKGSTADYTANTGGLFTHPNGIILDETILQASKTINIAAGSSASEIQALINEQPKNLNGHKLTFTFQGSRTNPQEYDLGTTQLNFDGFCGGEILVQGHQSETPTNRTGFVDISSASLTSNVVTVNTSSAHGLSTGDTVYLQNVNYVTTSPNGKQTNITVVDSDTFTFALTGANETYTVAGDSKMNASPPLGVKILTQNVNAGGAMKFEECTMVFVEHLHFEHNGTNDGSDILRVYNGTYATVQYCIVENTNTKANDAIYYSQSQGQFKHNRVNNLDTMVKAHNVSQVGIRDVATLVGVPHKVAPNHLIQSQGGSIVTQGSGTEYIATVSQSYINNGGVVMPHAGLILDETVLTGDKTVNFDSSMSVSDIQNIISDQPKNLNGYNITFQFADGTYDFGTTQLVFSEFVGGTVNIWGNQGNTLASNGTGLGVILQSEKTGGGGAILTEKCQRVGIKKIAFEQNGTNTDTNLLNITYSSDAVVENCSFDSESGTNTNDGIVLTAAQATVKSCAFNNLSYNVIARDASRVHSQSTFTFSGGTNGYRNLRAEDGSIITQNNTQAGGGNSRSADSGAVIFDKDGATT